ncbi:hypothetical protein BDR03DRAFT_979376 [Suillus americanus]|nr:hypothetical protein BDR03DRAFT_979376 [Suillus americanus]
MATGRYQGHCQTSAMEDHDHDDAVIMAKTASVTPLARNIPSTPPRSKQVLGLVTPPDSRSRPNSSFRSTSPPCIPVRHPDIPKDTTPLTLSGNLSEWSSDQSTTVPFLPLTGLLTPDNTPPRLSKPRFVLISDKEETTDQLESSLSLEITSTGVKISETNIGASQDTMQWPSQDVESFCHHYDKQDNGPPPSIPSANGKGLQSRQSRDTTTKPPTSKPSVQYNHEHRSQSKNTPTTVRRTAQCSATSKSKGRQCRQRVLTAPGQLTKDPSQPVFCRVHSEGNVIHVDVKLTKVQKELSARLSNNMFVADFAEFIPQYLQPGTQQKLRNAIKKGLSSKDKKPGYPLQRPGSQRKLVLKIGFSENVRRRHEEWQKNHPSIKDVRGWWPKTMIEAKDDDETLIQTLIKSNDQGTFGLMAAKLERLVHIELGDLVTHLAYLHPNFPEVHFSDFKRQDKAVPKPCGECSAKGGYPKIHREIFAFTRVEEGEFCGREWEDIVKPVIRKWGLFLLEYYAEFDDAMNFDSWALFITIVEVHLWTLFILSRIFTGLTWDVVR